MYTVKKGDTLSQLYGADWKNLSGYSGDPTKLQIGTQLNDLPVKSNVLTTGDIAPTSPLVIPPPVEDTTNYNGIINSGTTQVPPPAEDPMKAVKDYASTLGTPPSSADAYTAALGESGMTDAQKQVADLTAQLNSITAEGQVQNLSLENQGAGITAGGVSRSQTANNREIAIKALPVQAQLAAAQGNLTLATDKLNTLFKLKSDDATNLYNYNQKLIDKAYDVATQAQKDKLDQKRIDDQNNFTTIQNNLNQAQTWATTAISQGQGDIAAKIMALDPKDPNYQTKLGELAKGIKAKPTTSNANLTFTSGGITIPETAITAGQSTLDASRGNKYTNEKGEEITPTGTDASYANSKTYLGMLDAWKKDKLDTNDFFKRYPPKQYLNPNDSSIPQYIRDMLKANDGVNISPADISGALNNTQ